MNFFEFSNESILGKELRWNLYDEFSSGRGFGVFQIKNIQIFGFEEHLANSPTNKSVNFRYFDLFTVFFCSQLGFKWLSLFIASSFSSREATLYKYLNFRSSSLVLGDCIVSQWFRESSTHSLFSGSIHSKFSVFFLGLKIIGFAGMATQICRKNRSIQFFFIDETTGKAEALRRVFCTFSEMEELRFDLTRTEFRVIGQCTGIDIRKFYYKKPAFYEDITKDNLSHGMSLLEALVYRETTYRYLLSVDVDISLTFPVEKAKVRQKSVVIFLATISDAQYLFGIGPYADLHHWLMHSVEVARALGYLVYVKIHPGMSRQTGYAAKDRAYLRYLRDYFGVRETGTIIEETDCQEVFFLDSRISIRELSKGLPEFICITPHGSVAAEAGFLGHRAIVNANSQFGLEDKFVEIVSSPSDLKKILSVDRSSRAKLVIDRSLGCYVWFIMIRCNKYFTDELLSELGCDKVSSELIDDLLNQNLSDPIFQKRFSDACRIFVKSRIQLSQRQEIDNV